MPRSTSSRRKNKWQQSPRELSDSVNGLRRSQELPDGTWSVQNVAGNSQQKIYVCPGCGQDVSSSTPHIVAWRQMASYGTEVGVESRRHWHTRCFQRFR